MNRHFLAIASLSIASLSLVTASVLLPSPAQAHHRDGHNGGPPHQVQQAPGDSEPVSAQGNGLTADQQAAIIDLLQAGNDDYTIISQELRQDIRSQFNSLPPGIQRRLARGRGLPPGIARQVYLPLQVNRQINLDDNVRIVVIDRNVAVVDPVTELVVDILRDVLL